MGKIDRTQMITYLDTTPSSTTTWSLLGQGIESYGIDYNPQIDTMKYIINKAATSEVSSVQKQGAVSQKMYQGDACFEFAHSLKGEVADKIKTNILDIFAYEEETPGIYKAEKSEGILAVTKLMDEDAVIEYTLYYNGDPVKGTVTLTEGTPVFTADGSV